MFKKHRQFLSHFPDYCLQIFDKRISRDMLQNHNKVTEIIQQNPLLRWHMSYTQMPTDEKKMNVNLDFISRWLWHLCHFVTFKYTSFKLSQRSAKTKSTIVTVEEFCKDFFCLLTEHSYTLHTCTELELSWHCCGHNI